MRISPPFLASRLLLLPLLCLSGCSLLVDRAGLASIQSGAVVETRESLSVRQLSALSGPDPRAWWQTWQDPQLDRLMAQALQDNPDLRAARRRIEQAAALAGVADSASSVLGGVQANSDRERFSGNEFLPPPMGGGTYWNSTVGLGLHYDLDVWDRQGHLLQSALGAEHAQRAEAWQVRAALTAALAQTYADFALQRELGLLARKELERLSETEAMTRRRVSAGLGAGQEVDGLMLQRLRQARQVESLETSERLDRHRLAALAGLPPSAGEALRPALLADVAALELPACVPLDLLGRRPDVVAQHWRVEAATERVAAARADFYPNIDLHAAIGYQALGFSQFISGASATRALGAALTLPFFDGGRRRGALRLVTAAGDEAIEAYNATLLRAMQETADAVSRMESNQRDRDLAQQTVAVAEQRLAARQRGVHAGIGDYGALLDARAGLIAAQMALAQTDAERRRDYAALMLAIGGAWPQQRAGAQPAAVLDAATGEP